MVNQFTRSVIVLSLASLLAGCGWFSDQSKDYLDAKSAPRLEIPAHLSNSKVRDTYGIPSGPLWQADAQVSIYPPGSDLDKQQQAEQRNQAINRYQMGVGPNGEPAMLVMDAFNTLWAELPKALIYSEFKVVQRLQRNNGVIVFHNTEVTYHLLVLHYKPKQTVLILETPKGNFVPKAEAEEILSQINYGLIHAKK